jgi:thioredoxin reductase (NADPH)
MGDTMTKNPETTWDVLVVGGGPAGVTAGLYAARAGWSTAIVDKGVTAGALGMSSKITNFPTVSDPISGAELVERIRAQAAGFGASVVPNRITAAALSEESKTLFGTQEVFRGRSVVIATGSMGREPSIPGEARLIGRGVSYCATCDASFFQGQPTAVVGSTDEAIEEALHVARFAQRTYLLCPSDQFRADPALVRQAEENEGVEIRYSSQVREILGEGSVEEVAVESDGRTETLDVAGVFLYLQGGRPIVDFLGGQLDVTESGCLWVDDTLQTSVPGVFAAGDVLCKHIKQAVIAAAEGARAAIAADRYLSGRAALKPDWA